MTAPRFFGDAEAFRVMSAKKEATREKRLATLIADSAARGRLKHLIPPVCNKKKTP